MSGERAGVVVVGAGIVGASVAYHLAVRGERDVLVLERADREVTGSSARSLAGVRHQFANEVNIRLSQYSIARLARFTEEIGGHAELKQVGYLLLVSEAATWDAYRRNVELQNGLGVRSRLLTAAEARELVPGTRIDDLLGATYCPDDGYCDPNGIATGYLARARQLGARVRCGVEVIGIRVVSGRIAGVDTSAGGIDCETIVNAAGPWAGRVGAMAGIEHPVRPYRRCVYVTEPFSGIPRDIPLTIDTASGFYMRKERDALLFGLSNPDEPSSEDLTVDWGWLDHVLEAGVGRFPDLADAALAMKQCWAGLYEITPDHMPVLGRHPDLAGYVDASGFSGHGVMHAPATGMLMAEEILDGRAHTIDVDELRITRFAAGRLAREANVF